MAQIKRRASAQWQGSGKEGTGSLTTQSATLKDTPYGFQSRFGDGKGTNPEELIAAAHAGCFTMATAFQLSGAGHPPESLECNATLSMDQRAIVECLRDGPRSTGQSGHWLRFAQDISRRDGYGIDQDIKLFFSVAGVAFDAFVACWDAKR